MFSASAPPLVVLSSLACFHVSDGVAYLQEDSYLLWEGRLLYLHSMFGRLPCSGAHCRGISGGCYVPQECGPDEMVFYDGNFDGVFSYHIRSKDKF